MSENDYMGPNPGDNYDPDSALMAARSIQGLQQQMQWLLKLLEPFEVELLIDGDGKQFEALVDLSSRDTTRLAPYTLFTDGEDFVVRFGETRCRREDAAYSRTATDMTEEDGFVVPGELADGDKVFLKLEVDYPNIAKELTIETAAELPDDVIIDSGESTGYYYLLIGSVSIDGDDKGVNSVASSNFIFDVACDGLAIWGRL